MLYLWGLGSSGWANNYYAAAAQAGTQDWKAWLFGSLDAGNAITVDKPPAALWVMALSGRLFGFSAFTMLLPQALMGVGAVALLYATVRRTSGPAAGLIAGAALALTPVAALMFRFNNPDALLVLLLVAAAYCMVRATETASTRWIALAGCAIGFAFLTKMLQAFLVVPGFALAFLVAAPVGLWKRIGKLLIGAAAMIVSAGWYVALVSLWPADSRPYIGGSTDNSLLQLALGYNGIDRVVGGRGRSRRWRGPGGGPGGAGNLFFGGDPGIGRLFGLSMGTEASWLLPAALIGLAAGLWFTRRTARTGQCPCRTAAVGRLAAGDRRRVQLHGRHRPPVLHGRAGPGDRGTGRDLGARAVAGQGVPGAADRAGDHVREHRRLGVHPVGPHAGLVAGVALDRAGRIGRRGGGACGRCAPAGPRRRPYWPSAQSLFGAGAHRGLHRSKPSRNAHSGPMTMSGPSRDGGFGGGRGPGGAESDNAALAALVEQADNRWAAATVGSMTASSLELKTGTSVMAIGGFTGSDNSPTLAQFQGYVADGQVRYFIAGERGGPPGGRVGHRERHHDVGAAELHAHRCRRHDRVRPANTLTATIGCATQRGTIA